MNNKATDTHRVNGRLFAGHNRKELMPGDTVCAEDFSSPAELAEHVRSGFVQEITVGMTRVIHAPQAVPSNVNLSQGGVAPNLEGAPGKQVLLPPTQTARNKPVSKFSLDPHGLTGMPLEDLNVMLAERDSSIQPFDTVEEAIAYLSKDFVPAGK